MRFLGVDLASDPRRTGVVEATIAGATVRAALPAPGAAADDASLTSLVDAATVVGLDAPLGWPDDFVEAVAAHREFAPWPAPGADDGPRGRERFRLRATDRFVRGLGLGVTPLSASSDLIGVVAMRAAALQGAWASRWGAYQPRDGEGALVEVYPAAALRAWGLLERRGARYKGGRARDRAAERSERSRMLEALSRQADGWLVLDEDLVAGALDSDHVFDALFCALSAVAARHGATTSAPPETRARAAREGWIHVPSTSLSELGARLSR